MKIVFFGTPAYVLPIFEALHKKFKVADKSPIAAVVTQPPKKVGRKQLLSYSAVDTWAHKKGVRVYYSVQKLLDDNLRADLGILESYGEILPPQAINFFPHGIINAHPSLLPKFRGASPAQAAILMGEKESGATIIKLDNLVDHGPIIWQFKEKVFESDNGETLRERIFNNSVEVLINLVEPFVKGKINLKKQQEDGVIMTTRIKKEDAFIPPQALFATLKGQTFKDMWKISFIKIGGKPYTTHYSPITIHNFVRTMTPWPGAWTYIYTERLKNEKTKRRLKILKAHLINSLTINEQKLIIDVVQLEGKKPVGWEEFRRGYPNFSF